MVFFFVLKYMKNIEHIKFREKINFNVFFKMVINNSLKKKNQT